MNDMKHMLTSQLAILLLFAAGMAGCSEEDTLPGGNTPDSDRCPMTVSVSDGGYTAIHPSAPGTRAAEDGYTTRFTAGDKIGLYAVKDGAIVASNVCLTAETGGSGIAWTGNAYYEGAGTKYYAYYPWQSTLSGSPNASATDASGFFANVISQWIPATDQGTYAKYTAQDLMTGSSTSGSKQPDGTYSLSFTLTHAMALVVIETPTTKYKLTDASGNSLPDYDIPAPDTRFYGFTPYSPAVGTYRYLVKPAQSGAGDLMGSYTATATKEYAVTQNSLTAASYALYKVDGGVIEKQYTLQVGDFYYSDGNISQTLDGNKTCIGVVFSLPSTTTCYNNKRLVVALTDAGTASDKNNVSSIVGNYSVAHPATSSWEVMNFEVMRFLAYGWVPASAISDEMTMKKTINAAISTAGGSGLSGWYGEGMWAFNFDNGNWSGYGGWGGGYNPTSANIRPILEF